MRQLKIILLLLFSLSYLSFSSFAQESENLEYGDKEQKDSFPYVEPRKFLTIYEKKTYGSEPEEIWSVDRVNRGDTTQKSEKSQKYIFKTKQKHSVIGQTSILELHFDQYSLAHDINFRGSISLKAKSGDKNIEVAPYFVTGEQQKTFGVNSKPIKEIADNYLRMMIEAKKATSIYESSISDNFMTLKGFKKSDSNGLEKEFDFYIKDNLNVIKNYFERKKEGGDSIVNKESMLDVSYEVSYLLDYISSPVLYNIFYLKGVSSVNTILDELKDIEDVTNFDNRKRPGYIEKYKNSEARYVLNNNIIDDEPKDSILNNDYNNHNQSYLEFLKSIERCRRFLEYFASTGHDTKKAFFSIANMTEVDFQTITEKVNFNHSQIKTYENWTKIGELNSVSEIELVQMHLHSLYMYIDELTKISPFFSSLLKNHSYNKDFLRLQKYPSSYRNKNIWKLLENEDYSLFYDSNSYYSIRNELAVKAGEHIFSKLVYATIDISKMEVSDGQEIEISLVWYNIFNSDSGENPEDGVELATAKFIVKKVGWGWNAQETFLLINRIGENKLDPNYPISPSKFKPTAGASLLWGYNNDFRGQNFCGRTFRWLEFSAGINVSFLDCNTEKDFEIGAGPIIGLFNNQISFTAGYNLSSEGLSPYYMGIGFSFSTAHKKITAKAKGENNTNK